MHCYEGLKSDVGQFTGNNPDKITLLLFIPVYQSVWIYPVWFLSKFNMMNPLNPAACIDFLEIV